MAEASIRLKSEGFLPEGDPKCVANWPNFAVYQARTERQIPVVVLDPV